MRREGEGRAKWFLRGAWLVGELLEGAGRANGFRVDVGVPRWSSTMAMAMAMAMATAVVCEGESGLDG